MELASPGLGIASGCRGGSNTGKGTQQRPCGRAGALSVHTSFTYKHNTMHTKPVLKQAIKLALHDKRAVMIK